MKKQKYAIALFESKLRVVSIRGYLFFRAPFGVCGLGEPAERKLKSSASRLGISSQGGLSPRSLRTPLGGGSRHLIKTCRTATDAVRPTQDSTERPTTTGALRYTTDLINVYSPNVEYVLLLVPVASPGGVLRLRRAQRRSRPRSLLLALSGLPHRREQLLADLQQGQRRQG